MSYLQCPDCRLTVRMTAYLRGDECPRCRTSMEPRTGLARRGRDVKAPIAPRTAMAPAERGGGSRWAGA